MSEKKQDALAVVPEHRPATIKDWLSGDKFREAVAASLPSHMTADRFVRVALTAMMKTPKLADCTQASIFKVMLDLSSIGLEPDGRRAHIIPYGNVATLIIDYKGLIELAKRSGEVVNWRAEIVCENDKFGWENGVVTHKIDWRKPRGKLDAVYSHVRNKDGVDDYEVMTIDQVEAIRKRCKAGASGPWVTDFSEMAKKTVMRRHSKRLTLSPEFTDALAKDGDATDFVPPRVDPCPPGMSRTEFVATKLLKQTEPAETEMPETEAIPAEGEPLEPGSGG
jgi:recombination protein RecT